VLALLASSIASWAQPITPEQKQDVLKGVEVILAQRAFVPGADLAAWPERLEKAQPAIDAAEQQDQFARAVNRGLREFGVSHLRLRTPAGREHRQSASTTGVGLMTRAAQGSLEVIDLFPEGPAAQAGLEPGDTITRVDGRPPESPSDLTGASGSTIALTVKKSGGEVREVRLTRQMYSTIRPETLAWVGDDAAVLRIRTFAVGYDRANVERLISDATIRADFLVLDLRSNGGGAVSNMRHLLSLLLPPDTVVGTFVSRAAAARYRDAHAGQDAPVERIAAWWDRKFKTGSRPVVPYPGSVAVLVNRGSASASEIVAAALRELRCAPLVGTRTAGAVLESQNARLPHGFELQYPGNDYVTVQGQRLEHHPLEPDAEVAGPARGSGSGGAVADDPAVAKALELLRSDR
jgi:carboxyl-terminal processing protease